MEAGAEGSCWFSYRKEEEEGSVGGNRGSIFFGCSSSRSRKNWGSSKQRSRRTTGFLSLGLGWLSSGLGHRVQLHQTKLQMQVSCLPLGKTPIVDRKIWIFARKMSVLKYVGNPHFWRISAVCLHFKIRNQFSDQKHNLKKKKMVRIFVENEVDDKMANFS